MDPMQDCLDRLTARECYPPAHGATDQQPIVGQLARTDTFDEVMTISYGASFMLLGAVLLLICRRRSAPSAKKLKSATTRTPAPQNNSSDPE